MNWVYFYITGLVCGILLAKLRGDFYWSIEDEPIYNILRSSRIFYMKVFLWFLIWTMLFGLGSVPVE